MTASTFFLLLPPTLFFILFIYLFIFLYKALVLSGPANILKMTNSHVKKLYRGKCSQATIELRTGSPLEELRERIGRAEGVAGWVGEHPHRRRETGMGLGVCGWERE